MGQVEQKGRVLDNNNIVIIFGGVVASMTKINTKLTIREIMVTDPATSTYMQWSEVPI